MEETDMSAKFSLLAIALAALTFVPTTPASAQSVYFNSGFGNNINVRQSVMLNRINDLRARGLLTPGEYSRLMGRFNMISSRESMLRVGGLNFRERAVLESQLSQLNREIQVLGHNGNRQFASRWRRGWF
jgi:hypothetical protein